MRRAIVLMCMISSVINAADFYLDSNGVTIKCENASIGDTGVVNGITYTAVENRGGVSAAIDTVGDANGYDKVCTSHVTNMEYLFSGNSTFNDDISSWDISNVTTIQGIFSSATSFNQDIGSWDTSSVTDIAEAFEGATSFNQDIGKWDISKVNTIRSIFKGATSFNQYIGNWDTSAVTNMASAFSGASSFNQYIGNWDTSNVNLMTFVFQNATSFDQPLNNWDTSSVTRVEYMFQGATAFNQPIGNWDTTNITAMDSMFENATTFNQPVGDWNTINVTNMTSMFENTSSFDQNITKWCVTNISSEPTLFDDSSALSIGNLPTWGTCPTRADFYLAANGVTIKCPNASVGDTGVVNGTTYTAVENSDGVIAPIDTVGDANGYDKVCTTHVTDMKELFQGNATFNEDISSWDTSSVMDTSYMFSEATLFNQPIGDWDTSNVTDFSYMFNFAGDFNQSIGKWNTRNAQSMAHLFHAASSFDRDISTWDLSTVTNVYRMFYATSDFNQDISNWDVSNITTMTAMFEKASSFDQNLSTWDTSSATNMRAMFYEAESFNGDISTWDTSKVTNMNKMFGRTLSFNQNIGSWDLSDVNDTANMFVEATAFNRDIGDWNTSKITDMSYMFAEATAFNQDISSWSVSNIVSKPTGFDTSSGFENQDDLQPYWGYSPYKGTIGNDTIIGTSSDEIFLVSEGDDTIDGEDGDDTIVYDSAQLDYYIRDNGDGTYTITDSDYVYSDTITNIEYISFSDNKNISITDAITIQAPSLKLKAHGGVLQFDYDNNSSINTSNTIQLGTMTAEAMINCQELSSGEYYNIISIGEGSDEIFHLYINPNSKIEYAIRSLGGTVEKHGSIGDVGSICTNDSWQHVAMVFDDSSDSLAFYIDGVDTSITWNNVDNTGFTLSQSHPLKIGTIRGMIDEVRIWDVARTQSEINSTINTQLDGNETGLVAYYNFDERVGETIYDITSNNNDITKDDSVIRLNFLGTMVKFAGNSSSYIKMDYQDSYNDQETFSFSLWVNAESLSGNILSFYDDEAHSGYALYFENGSLVFGMGDGSSLNPLIVEEITTDRWYQVSVTYDGNNIILYLNGNTKSSTFDSSEYQVNGDSINVVLGESFTGMISEVSIWKKTLSAQEIQNVMDINVDLNDSDLAGYWSLTNNSIQDDTSNSNHASGYTITWNDVNPTLYGNTIYSKIDAKAKTKLLTENFSDSVTISFSNPLGAPVSIDGETIFYTPLDTTSYNIDFTAISGVESANLELVFKSYSEATASSYLLSLVLSDVNTSEHNITNLFIVDADNYSGTIDTSNSVGVSSFYYNYLEGTRSFTESIEYLNYIVVFETDGSTNDQAYWYYHKSDGKLYSQADYNSATSSDFISSYSDSTSFTISLTSTNWIDSSANTTESVDDTNIILLYPIEEKIDSYDSSSAKSFSTNDLNNSYQIYQTYESNQKFINIEKTLLLDFDAYKVAIKLLSNTPNIESTKQTLHEFNTTTNIISIIDNNTTVQELYLNSILDESALATMLNDIYKDHTINLNTNSKGYELYKKQVVTQCEVDSYSTLQERQYTTIDRLKEIYVNNGDANSSAQNILVYNKYDSAKGLQLTLLGQVIEIDLSNENNSWNRIGTWSTIDNVNCTQDRISLTPNTILSFTFDSNEDGYGYEHIAIVKDKDGNYVQGTYTPINTLTKEIYFNQEATESIAQTLNISSGPLQIKHHLTHDWTYLSMPTNINICTNEYKNLLNHVCDQEFSIESIFSEASSENNISVFKYRGGYWSYYTTDGKTYNMDKLTSINQTDGLLIYNTPYQKDIYLPYDIYSLKSSSLNIYDLKGWHLVGNQFTKSPDDIKSDISSQGYSLKYIMKQDGYEDGTTLSWKVSVTNNDEEIDSTLESIDELAPKDAMWIYVEE